MKEETDAGKVGKYQIWQEVEKGPPNNMLSPPVRSLQALYPLQPYAENQLKPHQHIRNDKRKDDQLAEIAWRERHLRNPIRC
jgi:hypothetical protein